MGDYIGQKVIQVSTYPQVLIGPWGTSQYREFKDALKNKLAFVMKFSPFTENQLVNSGFNTRALLLLFLYNSSQKKNIMYLSLIQKGKG